VGLIGEAAIRGDLPERGIGRQHHLLSLLHSPAHHVSVWRVIEVLPECSAEVGGAQLYYRGKIIDPDRGLQIRLDVRRDPPYLPRCQAAPNGPPALFAPKIDFLDRIGKPWVNLEDSGGPLHTSLRRFGLILKPIVYGLENLRHRGAQPIRRSRVQPPPALQRILTPCQSSIAPSQ
jgi:hypothetical protein